MTQFRKLLPLLAFAIAFTGCDLVDPDDDGPDQAGAVFIGNQGEFGAGNGTITRYDPATNAAATAYRNLETIIQSIEIDGDHLFIAANSGGRVDVYDHRSGELVGIAEGLLSPRYIATSNDRIYATNFYADFQTYTGGTVSVIDRATFDVVDEIEVGDNPEGIARVGNRLFVANYGLGAGRTVTVIDADAEDVESTIDVGCDGPRFVLPDEDGDVFVTCTGRTIYDENYQEIGRTDGEIVILDPTSGAVIDRLEVEGQLVSADFGQDAYFDRSSRRLFVLNERDGAYHVLTVDTRTNELDGEIGPIDGRVGSIAYDPFEKVIYLGMVTSYTQAGTVVVMDEAGETVRSFTAGVAPTSIRIAQE